MTRARIIQRLSHFWDVLEHKRTFGVAAEMSFWLFLSLLPMSAVAALIASRLALKHTSLLTLINLPAAGRELLQHELTEIAAWESDSVAPFALLTFLWLASSGFHAIFDGFEAQLGFSNAWWRKRLAAVVAALLLPVGMVVIAILSSGLDWTQRMLVAEAPLIAAWSSLLGRSTRTVLAFGISYTLVYLLFRIGVPRAARAGLSLSPAALCVVGLHWGLTALYRVYLTEVAADSAYQAGLAAVATTMITLYLVSLSLLVGLAVSQLWADLVGRTRRSIASRY